MRALATAVEQCAQCIEPLEPTPPNLPAQSATGAESNTATTTATTTARLSPLQCASSLINRVVHESADGELRENRNECVHLFTLVAARDVWSAQLTHCLTTPVRFGLEPPAVPFLLT